MNTTTYRTRQMSFEDIQDKKKCDYTGKNVAVYEITTKGIEQKICKPYSKNRLGGSYDNSKSM